MSAKVHVRLFGRDQQKPWIGLRAAGAEVGFEFLETQRSEIAGVAVAVKIHDHGRIHAHVFEDWLERRRPVKALFKRLPGIGEVPVRRGHLESVEGREAVAVRISLDLRQYGSRLLVGQQVKHAHVLPGARRRVHPGIIAGVVVRQLANTDGHRSAKRAVPQVAHVGSEIARKEVLVRRRKDRDTPARRAHGQRAVTRGDGNAFGALRAFSTPLAGGIGIGDLRRHVSTRLHITGSGDAHTCVVKVGHVRLLRAEDGLLPDQPAPRIEGVCDGPIEDAHLHSSEDHLNAITRGPSLGIP